MGRHAKPEPTPTTTRRPEPVAIAALIQAVLAAVVAIGWLRLDDPAIETIGTAAAVVVSVVVTMFARSKVTPVADPQTPDGTELAPLMTRDHAPTPTPREAP